VYSHLRSATARHRFDGFMKQYNATKMWFTSGTGYIYNTTSLGSITKITLSYNVGGSPAAVQRFNVGNTAMTSYMSSGGTTVSTSTEEQLTILRVVLGQDSLIFQFHQRIYS
jgi:hypothetical protein